MKRLKNLFFTLVLCVPLMADAQGIVMAPLQFIDHEGNVIPDGSDVTFTTPNEGLLQYGIVQIPMEVSLKNAGNIAVDCVVDFDVTYIDADKGAFFCCAFGNCVQYNKIGVLTKGPVTINAGGTDTTLRQTEWSPEDETTWGKVQFTVTAKCFLGSTSIKVTIENAAPTLISDISDNNSARETARYNAAGQRIYQPQRGINIVHYSNGVILKTIIK